MATATKRSGKHFQLDSDKIKCAQRALHAKTETEAIEHALDFAIAEHEKNRSVLQATERFIKSGIEIKNVYDTLVVRCSRSASIPRLAQVFGLGFLFVPINLSSYVGIPTEKSNSDASLVNFMRNVGSSVGTSMVTTIIAR